MKHRFSEKQEIMLEEFLILSGWSRAGLSKVVIIALRDEPRSETAERKRVHFSE